MTGPPSAEATRPGATLSGDVVVREAVEAETHKIRRDGAVAFGRRSPRTASLMTTLDDLESIDVNVGPLTWLPRCVMYRRPTLWAEALVHQDSCHRLRT
jgi:hypothetical protein